jgi:hypothetical protein
MRYFDEFFAKNDAYEELEISVLCDVEIFEMLMAYAHDPTTPPVLETRAIVSLLISSDFLKMAEFVELCLLRIAERSAC